MTDHDLAALCAASYTRATWTAGDMAALQSGAAIAVRGTRPDCLADWCRDLDLLPEIDPLFGPVHAGFLGGAQLLYPALRPHLTAETVLTGHSLGGAVACLLAALALADGIAVAALVTFGAPRVGGPRLVRYLAGLDVRQYRDGDDPVTEVPAGYQHVRLPLIEVGHPVLVAVEDHFVAEYEGAV